MASLFPDHGARLVLERDLDGGNAGARYRVNVYLPEGVHAVAQADLTDDCALGDWSEAPPAWVEAFLVRLLRGLIKKHRGDGDFPRKITRWREPLP